jgi:acetyltransferase-like isoleucine patch superfamily enzyme
MRHAGLDAKGRWATRLATWFAPPHKAATLLAKMNPIGFVSPSAIIHHTGLTLGANILIGDRVILYQAKDGGRIVIGDRACVLRDTAIETGYGGEIFIGSRTWIQPRGQVNAYLGSIRIGAGVDIAPNCALYAYDHGFAREKPIRDQALTTKGDIVIGDHAWLGVGATVLSGVNIGEGAVVAAGSVVTEDIPDFCIAAGSPASVVGERS